MERIMKRILLLVILFIGFTTIEAQTIEEGRTHMYYERLETAENTFHQVLKADAQNAEAWYYLVKSYAEQKMLDKAKDSLNMAPGTIRDEPYFQVAQGFLFKMEKKDNEANELFDRALDKTRKKDAGILAAVADAHIEAKTGDPNYAIELLKRAIKRDKRNPALYVKLGDAHRKMINGTDAFIAYRDALDHDKNYALAYHRMGKIFLTQDNPGIYMDYFKQAIDADPKFAPSLYMLYVYEFKRDPVKAMEYYNAYLANSENSIRNQYDLADLFYVNKEYDKAIDKAKAILEKQQDDAQPRLYKLLGYSVAAKNDTANAIGYMQKYLDIEADSNIVARDYLTMSEFYATQGKDSLVLANLEKGSMLEKDSSKLFRIL